MIGELLEHLVRMKCSWLRCRARVLGNKSGVTYYAVVPSRP